MTNSKILFLALIFIFLHGCRIIQEVPTGGSVVSESGLYDCGSGQTCEINFVDGAEYSVSFTAVPDDGFRFVKWKESIPNEYASLCGGKTGDCAFTASGELTAYDVDVYLSPVFADFSVVTVRGSVEGAQEPNYAFSASAGATVSALLSDFTSDLDLYVYDSDSNCSSNSLNTEEACSLSVGGSGDFFVSITDYENVGSTFNLTVDLGPGSDTELIGGSVQGSEEVEFTFGANEGATVTVALFDFEGDLDFIASSGENSCVANGSVAKEMCSLKVASDSQVSIRILDYFGVGSSFSLSLDRGQVTPTPIDPGDDSSNSNEAAPLFKATTYKYNFSNGTYSKLDEVEVEQGDSSQLSLHFTEKFDYSNYIINGRTTMGISFDGPNGSNEVLQKLWINWDLESGSARIGETYSTQSNRYYPYEFSTGFSVDLNLGAGQRIRAYDGQSINIDPDDEWRISGLITLRHVENTKGFGNYWGDSIFQGDLIVEISNNFTEEQYKIEGTFDGEFDFRFRVDTSKEGNRLLPSGDYECYTEVCGGSPDSGDGGVIYPELCNCTPSCARDTQPQMDAFVGNAGALFSQYLRCVDGQVFNAGTPNEIGPFTITECNFGNSTGRGVYQDYELACQAAEDFANDYQCSGCSSYQ